jgi:hypothetical protein
VPRAVGVQIVVLGKQRGRALRLAHVGQAVELIIPVFSSIGMGPSSRLEVIVTSEPEG